MSEAPIFLVGFMGAGKTTAGRALARMLNRIFLDLDEIIADREGKSVREVFAESGEARFRTLEREAIESCRELKQAVIALGGGAYVSEANRALLRGVGPTIWLDCPLELCIERIAGDESRPLATGAREMKKLLDSRRPAYEAADFAVQTSDKSPEQIASMIADMLGLRS